jgi:hypothetical protein
MRLSLRPALLLRPQQLLVSGAWLLALLLTAWILASWYWQLSGTPVQSARPTPVSDPLVAAQEIASRQLFGSPSATTLASGTAGASSLVLIGVSTRWGTLPGFAIIKDGAAPAMSVVEGEEIANGIKLVHVLADAVEIDRNGTHERLPLNVAPRSGPDTQSSQQNQTTPPTGVSAPAAAN